MAHGIKIDGVDNDRILIEGDKGWHGLGENRDAISPKDVREAFPWDWKMDDMLLDNGNKVDGFKAVTSEGNAVGVVSERYTMIGIDDVISLAEDIITNHGTGRIVSAGTLHGRQDFFLDLELDKEFRHGDDVNKPFIGLSNNAVGSRHFIGGAHMHRMVCANTLNLMIGETKASPRCIKVRHSKSAHWRLTEAKRILGISCAAFDKADAEMQAMIAKTLNDKDVEAFYDKVMPVAPLPKMENGETSEAFEARLEKVERANRKSERIRLDWFKTLQLERRVLRAPSPNLWLALNSVTKWAQHDRTVRGESDDKLMRVWSNRFSDGFDITNEAHDIAVSML